MLSSIHTHKCTDKHTCRLKPSDPGASDTTNPPPHQRWHTSSLIACCPLVLSSLQGHNPCSLTHTYTHTHTPLLAPRAVLQFLSVPVPGAAAGATQVAVDINEPKLSPRVKCRHLTHLGPGEGPQPRQDWSFYKPPNEGLLAIGRRGQTQRAVPEHVHVLLRLRLPFKQYCGCYCNSYCCSCCSGNCCQVYWQSVDFDGKAGERQRYSIGGSSSIWTKQWNGLWCFIVLLVNKVEDLWWVNKNVLLCWVTPCLLGWVHLIAWVGYFWEVLGFKWSVPVPPRVHGPPDSSVHAKYVRCAEWLMKNCSEA